MYIRICRTVRDVGVLVRPEEFTSVVKAEDGADWYRSAFTYGEDAKEYWEANSNSIKGYNGKAFTSALYFDLDFKADINKARKAAIDVITKLSDLGFSENTFEIFFSGNKGFHVFVHTTGQFTPQETQVICYNLAREAGVPNDVFDTSVYNVTRIFRITNTKHQESGLYKIPISIDELEGLPEDDIRLLAKKPRFEEFDIIPQDASKLRELYATKIQESAKVIELHPQATEPNALEPKERNNITQSGLDLSKCPPGHRKCVWALEQGHFGPGERHNAVVRLGAYYKGQGFNRKYAETLIYETLKRRAEVFPQANQPEEAELQRDIDQVYSKDWKGGMFTCKTDAYLQTKCDQGHGPCWEEARSKVKNVLNVSQLFNSYVEYSQQALIEYPNFGLKWLDDRIRLRPKNFTLINGANGSGKTSLAIQAIEQFNKQEMYNVFFSLDMANSSIFEKLGARYTHYSPREIEAAFNIHTFNTDIVNDVKAALDKALPYTLFDFTSNATFEYIEETVSALKASEINIQVVVIDYAGRIPGTQDNQYANATANANMANDVAKRTNTHLLILSQVSRENGDHTDPLRTSRVAKESGAWEENATSILNCWRPLGNGIQGQDNYMHIYIAKNRSGPLGEWVFMWEGKRGNISELTENRQYEEYVRLCEQYKLDPPKYNYLLGEETTDDQYDTEYPNDNVRARDTDSGDSKKISHFKPGAFKRNK